MPRGGPPTLHNYEEQAVSALPTAHTKLPVPRALCMCLFQSCTGPLTVSLEACSFPFPFEACCCLVLPSRQPAHTQAIGRVCADLPPQGKLSVGPRLKTSAFWPDSGRVVGITVGELPVIDRVDQPGPSPSQGLFCKVQRLPVSS